VISPRIISLYVVASAAVGCASPMTSLREDNRRLTQTVTELRGDRRIQDRKLRDMQHQLDELHSKGPSDAAASIPELPVEVAGPAGGSPTSAHPTSRQSSTAPSSAAHPAGLAPSTTSPSRAALAPAASSDVSRVVAVTDDGTEIVYEGEAILGRTTPPLSLQSASSNDDDDEPAPARRAPAASRTPAARPPAPLLDVPVVADRLEVTRRVPVLSARTTRSKTRDHDAPSERSGDAASDYRIAVELVKAGKHDEAVAALRSFVTRYPRHDYADNAQYWLGEAFYAQKDYARALTEFRKVIEVYPRGNKVPDALLKVGYCHHVMGQAEKARAVLEQVVNLYPKSEPAALAAKRLETP
jgi:tol-pal system protein YbgF